MIRTAVIYHFDMILLLMEEIDEGTASVDVTGN
jgi:hypothetical protein